MLDRCSRSPAGRTAAADKPITYRRNPRRQTMLFRTTCWAAVLALLPAISSARGEQAEKKPTAWRCLVPPIEPCFSHRGRLSAQNGIAHIIWLIGTKRVVAVDNAEIPHMLAQYLDMTSPEQRDVYGVFELCPIEPDRPGYMRSVCVDGARDLIVQDRDRSRPPIRLLSTWQKKSR